LPTPIKHRLPGICEKGRGFGEIRDHGRVSENVEQLEAVYTGDLLEKEIIGDVEGPRIHLRGGPPGDIIEMVCGGRVDRLHSPDTNANEAAGPFCISHGGSDGAKSLRIDGDYFYATVGGCTDTE
ncbi:MAG: hypothetical protein KDC98_11845, partial [Planctomycetes bacterium]|nr:hypothetical protein [Planctomycetota bacterium]